MSDPIDPVDHLEGQAGRTSDLLTHLTDHQLEEQIIWLRQQRNAATSPQDSYHYGKQLYAAVYERDQRSGE